MILELLQIKSDILSVDGYATFIVYADPGTTGQYVTLGAKGFDSPDQIPLCGPDSSIDTEVRVKATTGTTEGAFKMLAKIRTHFPPSGTKITVAGRDVTFGYVRSEFVDVDRDSTITGTSRHPAFGVDTYRLVSQPA